MKVKSMGVSKARAIVMRLDCFHPSWPSRFRDIILQTQPSGLSKYNFVGNPDLDNVDNATLVLFHGKAAIRPSHRGFLTYINMFIWVNALKSQCCQ